MALTIGFDVYGTLVDPIEMGQHLAPVLGSQARIFGQLWHEKKVEYAFRRGLMDQYQNFTVCTQQALRYCLAVFDIRLSNAAQQELIAKFNQLPAFNDVIPGLTRLKAQGHTLAAFSNGPEASVRTLMQQSGMAPMLDECISVDDVQTYKPSPMVYHYLIQRTHSSADQCWLVSSNAWDVIGAKAAGLKTAWIQRDPSKIFDPWEFEPDLVVRDLIELSEKINQPPIQP
jgi:2-haloacid dehalogenase